VFVTPPTYRRGAEGEVFDTVRDVTRVFAFVEGFLVHSEQPGGRWGQGYQFVSKSPRWLQYSCRRGFSSTQTWRRHAPVSAIAPRPRVHPQFLDCLSTQNIGVSAVCLEIGRFLSCVLSGYGQLTFGFIGRALERGAVKRVVLVWRLKRRFRAPIEKAPEKLRSTRSQLDRWKQ
jgi:hypothetical protein